ncbi:GntR family transcriptional regulator [Enterovibrio norvegicus FF-33]|uniref:GntR family transcriptional regulator n=1 Tax=Enterovibrio norvegicus FF-454 TaxID=1185651 RepID=A0A1E5CFV1_9GAMM|nr:GntR family transcriptional regulator [Enterovibrio norvegicus]OEE64367.1 GntR family transcriptional regulator [Enterovibrio norvegicus FF-454]OEE68759.1 GntR family transcriptional regulator [Enterovibrio norvegicus FF-33]OEE82361.1 GntR family transcriptional regulator [Enterovibrio norvegicus FF-162]
MHIVIDPQDPSPKFRQLMTQIQRQIVAGTLKPGDKLTSVRKLAAVLNINPMTISRCYQNMEELGWLERRRGVGMIVAREGLHARMEDRFGFIRPALRALLVDAREVGYSKSEVMALVMQYWDEE